MLQQPAYFKFPLSFTDRFNRSQAARVRRGRRTNHIQVRPQTEPSCERSRKAEAVGQPPSRGCRPNFEVCMQQTIALVRHMQNSPLKAEINPTSEAIGTQIMLCYSRHKNTLKTLQ